MKRSIIDRYEMNDSRQVVVDVSVRSVEDLLDRFDRSTPYLKKDLDPQFVDYLIGCAQELGRHDFIIRINLANPLLLRTNSGFNRAFATTSTI